jgi:hypothetical protein
MARSVFGWDLPPGCTLRHIEEAYGDEGPCECCGHDPADCICPECPTCGSAGDKSCYHNTILNKDGHGLQYNREQLIGQCRMRIADLRFQLQEEEQTIKFLEDGGEIDQ